MDRSSPRRWRRRAGIPLAVVAITALTPAPPALAADEPDTTAPVISYAGIADGTLVGPETLIRPQASDNVAVTTMDLLINGVRYATSHAPGLGFRWYTNAIPAGDTTVQVIAYDAAGNPSLPATATVRVDNQAPTVALPPLSESYTGTGKIAFQVPDTDVTRIELLSMFDGHVLGSAASAPWVVSLNTTTPYNGPVDVMLRAYDAAGNISTVRGKLRLDNVAPQLTIHPDWPTQKGYIRYGGILTIGVRDDSRNNVDLLVNGAVVSSDSGDDGTAALRWPNTPNGTAGMTVRATDVHGHVTEISEQVLVDNDAPLLGLNVADGTDVRQNFPVKVTSVRDTSGLAYLTPSSKTLRGGSTPTAPSWTTAFGGTRGWHTFSLLATDKAGNQAWTHRRVYLDDQQPTVTFSKTPKNNSKLSKTVNITAKATDNRAVTRVQLLVNGKIVATDTRAGYTFTLNPKKYGKKFTVELRAYDRAGNIKHSTKRTYRR